MNFEVKDIPAKILPLLQSLKKYLVMVFILFFVGVYGLLVFRINTLAASEPDQSAIDEKLERVQRPRIDKAAIDKIEKLQDQNIQVKSLFEKARQNPFDEK